jgi:hypothetical protein
LFAALSVSTACAADRYVSTAGSNLNPGTESAPWATISHALGSLEPGDTLHVLGGDYTESILVSGLRGTQDAPITILGHDRPKITATGQDVFLVQDNSAWLVFDGFELTGGSRSGMIVTKSTQIVVRNCLVHHNQTWGVQTCLADHITVEDCELHSSSTQHGIYFSTTDYPAARNNLIYNNPRCGIHMNGDLSEGGDGMITGAIIVGNIIHDCGWDGGAGINMDGGEQAFVANNLLYNNQAGGITSYCYDGLHGGADNRFYFNTVYFAPGVGRFGLQLYAGSTGATVKDNILICGRAALEVDSESLPGLQSDHNLFICHGSSTPISAPGAYSLTSWQSASGLDAHSLSVMPQFLDLPGGDFRLAPGSPGIDDGTLIAAVDYDILGQPRAQGAAPDIGAYETAAAAPPPSGTGLLGEYFHDMALAEPALTRIDPKVDFVWLRGVSPDPALDEETFSVRWSGEVEPRYSETYSFHTVSDDGVRLWVNGVRVIDDWSDHSARETTAGIALAAGQRVPIVMEYYDNRLDARAQFFWSSPSRAKEIIPTERLYPATPLPPPPPPPAGDGAGLLGEYFHDMEFGDIALTRVDPAVDFTWPRGVSPDPALDEETFSVRWSGEVEPLYSETYTFYTLSDDGVRLAVNDLQIINNWTDHGATENQGRIALQAGEKARIVMEFYDNRLDARARLAWSSPSQVKQTIPQDHLYPANGGTTPPPLGDGIGLRGEYFDDMALTELAATRIDPVVNFIWPRGTAPHPNVDEETFSVRWSGFVEPIHSETWTFHTVSDDGVRLWVDGVLLVDDWTDHSSREGSGRIDLSEGERVPIVMEFYDNRLDARAQLHWSSPSQPRQPIPSEFLYPE